ncbi:MAG: hypothetical protein B6226_01585 [Candidatus Cloacimonetes bacterium 4572_65]|nr:MAG: hypothetical protein B6226_01585 [Candidatus Cloacimonetes bacterium 4572_65]
MQNLSVNEVIEFALNIERNGKEFYESALQRKDLNSKTTEILTMLRDEEIAHESYFKSIRDSEDLNNLFNSVGWEVASSYLNTIVQAHIFNDKNSAIKLAAEADKPINIIEYAIQFEKDTLLYFHSINNQTKDPKAKKAITSILQEEMKHLAKLQTLKNNF